MEPVRDVPHMQLLYHALQAVDVYDLRDQVLGCVFLLCHRVSEWGMPNTYQSLDCGAATAGPGCTVFWLEGHVKNIAPAENPHCPLSLRYASRHGTGHEEDRSGDRRDGLRCDNRSRAGRPPRPDVGSGPQRFPIPPRR